MTTIRQCRPIAFAIILVFLLSSVIAVEADETLFTGQAAIASTAPHDDYDVCLQGCQYNAIQAALDQTAPGAPIRVAPGTYRESIVFRKDNFLVGAGPGTTIIQGDGTQSVVRINGAIGGGIEGFTITGGGGSIGGGLLITDGASSTVRSNHITGNQAADGGGVYIHQGSPTFTYNLISNNSASQYGGGLVVNGSQSAPSFFGNRILENTAARSGGAMFYVSGAAGIISDNHFGDNRSLATGGGIDLQTGSSPFVHANRFAGNQAEMDGGAIYVELNSNPSIENNWFDGNHAGRFGGAMVINDAQPEISNNLLLANRAGARGSGLFLRHAHPTLRNNTLANHASEGSGEAIVLSGDCNPVIEYNIIVQNMVGIMVEAGNSQPQVGYNDVWANTTSNYSGIPAPPSDLSVDPLFASGQYGDHYLQQRRSGQPDSPLIDAGNITAAALNLDGLTTRIDGFSDQGLVDLGYHYPRPTHRLQIPVVER